MLGVGMQPSSSMSGEYEEVLVPKKRSPIMWVLIGMFGLLTVIGLGIGAYFLFVKGGSNIEASVAHTDAGETLRLHFPDATAGTKIRFGDVEKELKSQKADFALTSKDLTLGENELSVGVVDAEGAVTEETILINLSYRIRPDLTALSEETPSLRILVDAQPGAKITLDGEALTLDAKGQAKKEYPLTESQNGGAVDRTLKYTIVSADGERSEGSVHAVIPIASLRIDRPGQPIVTDQTSMEIAGLVQKGSSVSIDGADVAVKDDGHFSHTLALAKVGNIETNIVAKESGKVPRNMSLTIKRVADLEKEAAKFEVDKTINYKALSDAPASFKGKHASFIGRVYNVDVHKGKSVLQILVQDCPTGKRCPLWINYGTTTEYTTKDWVKVLGAAAGEQQFRAASGELKSVPSIDATYLLRHDPNQKKKRRRRR